MCVGGGGGGVGLRGERQRKRQSQAGKQITKDKNNGNPKETERNSKALILKDSNITSIWTCLTASPCYTTNTNIAILQTQIKTTPLQTQIYKHE